VQADEFPLQYIKGVGPKRAAALAAAGLRTPRDVIRNIPRGYVDRSAVASIAELHARLHSDDLWTNSADAIVQASREVSVVGTVLATEVRPIGKNRKLFKASIADESGAVAQLIFWSHIQYFEKSIREGDSYAVSGIAEYDARWHTVAFTHPELERIDADDAERFRQGAILPKYTLTQAMKSAGITMRIMRTIVEHVIESVAPFEREIFPDEFMQRMSLPHIADVLRTIHFPKSHEEISAARRRLVFEELFFFELMLAARQRSRKATHRGIQMDVKSPMARTLVERLPFELTVAQRRVIHEIMSDMSSGSPMNRLLQGDVGSGKTIVALLCMLNVIENGYQTLIMAPTEILAEQHFRNIQQLTEGLSINVVQLVGGQRKKYRAELTSVIASGEAQIIVGTHAAFEADILYKNLGLVVIDEQHRFGVAQRAELKRLGVQSHGDDAFIPHFLVMSATPIPRTLSMTLYGDLDVSVIDELPKNRKPIKTKVVFSSGISKVYDFIRTEVSTGRQAYVVYPLVEKSEKLELKSAVEFHDTLSTQIFPDLRVGLLHGQMLWYEKEEVMDRFLHKEIDILVATTVIEVGVDVANATIMLIEDAERFGLAQLHQLRGRVGRGADQSYCFLATKDHFRYAVSKANAAEDRAKSALRLRTMEETTDGFRIAEVDLNLRGPGDMMGTRQSGLPEFHYADLVTDAPLISVARKEAFALFDSDPQLRKAEHEHIRERLINDFEAKAFVSVA